MSRRSLLGETEGSAAVRGFVHVGERWWTSRISCFHHPKRHWQCPVGSAWVLLVDIENASVWTVFISKVVTLIKPEQH
jgi:hypothetical protein